MFTRKEINEIVKRYDNGKGESSRAISDDYGCNHKDIIEILRSKKVDIREATKYTHARLMSNIETISKLYDDGYSSNTLADIYNASGSAVLCAIREGKLTTIRSQDVLFNDEELLTMFYNNNSTRTMAAYFNCSRNTVRRRLRKLKVKLSDRTNVYIPEDELIDLYNKGYSCRALGRHFGTTGSTIVRRLHDNDIEVRDREFYRGQVIKGIQCA